MYSTLAGALARAKERSGAKATDDAYLTELLTLSAGKDSNGVTQYRPFFVAAKFLEQNRAQQTLKKARDGIEFTGLATPIASLLALQASADAALGLTVPAGFEAISTDASSAGGSSAPRRFNTRSQSGQISP